MRDNREKLRDILEAIERIHRYAVDMQFKVAKLLNKTN